MGTTVTANGFCTSCGTAIQSGNRFCGRCGNALAASASVGLSSPGVHPGPQKPSKNFAGLSEILSKRISNDRKQRGELSGKMELGCVPFLSHLGARQRTLGTRPYLFDRCGVYWRHCRRGLLVHFSEPEETTCITARSFVISTLPIENKHALSYGGRTRDASLVRKVCRGYFTRASGRKLK